MCGSVNEKYMRGLFMMIERQRRGGEGVVAVIHAASKVHPSSIHPFPSTQILTSDETLTIVMEISIVSDGLR